MLSRKAVITIIALIIISPLFGVILADAVGYHEPLDVAAEKLGLKDVTDKLNWTPFLDYSVPGLPATVGYIVSGFIGVAAVLGLGYVIKAVLGRKS